MKIRFILICIFLFFYCTFVISEEEKNHIIYKSVPYESNPGCFEGYIVKDNQLYICTVGIEKDNITDKVSFITYVLKFQNNKLIKLNISENELKNYLSLVRPTYDIESKDNKIIIDEKRYIELGEEDNPRITLIEGQKERYLGGYVFSTPVLTYMYLDKENEKLYFAGSGVKKVRGKYESTRGILVYDIKTGNVSNFALSEEVPEIENMSIEQEKVRDLEYLLNPIRVPNTSYLLFFIDKRVNNKYFCEIAIKEVPEWKAELDQQEKNKKENPKAKTAYTNGSANVRDNPKGKVISTLNDWTEVLILEQKDDWYHILYADIEGWTYKDNIRQKEK